VDTTPSEWVLDEVFGPSDDHLDARSAMQAALARYLALPDPEQAGWLTIVANEDAWIEVTPTLINLGRRELDLDALLRDEQGGRLSRQVRPVRSRLGKPNRTLWNVKHVSADDLAAILDSAFLRGFGLEPAYSVRVRFQPSGNGPLGALEHKPSHLRLAGRLLFLVAAAGIVLVATFLGRWVFSFAVAPPLLLAVPLGVVCVLAGVLIWRVGSALLRRAGIAVLRDEDA
jgi:hypothetical protein